MHIPIDLRLLRKLGISGRKEVRRDSWSNDDVDEGVKRKRWEDLMGVKG